MYHIIYKVPNWFNGRRISSGQPGRPYRQRQHFPLMYLFTHLYCTHVTSVTEGKLRLRRVSIRGCVRDFLILFCFEIEAP